MSMSHLPPSGPPWRLPVDSSYTYQRLQVFSAGRCSQAVRVCVALSQNRPEVLGNQCLQERPSMRARNPQVRTPAFSPQWKNSEMYSAQSLNRSQQDWVSTVLSGDSAHHHTLRWLFSFPCLTSLLPHCVSWDNFQMNSLYQILVLGSAFGGTQTKTEIKPSIWLLERYLSTTLYKVPHQNRETQKLS